MGQGCIGIAAPLAASGAIRLRPFVATQEPVYGNVPDAPTRAVPFVTGVLSRQTSFLVYCEQKGDDLCANGQHAAVVHRFLYFCSMLSLVWPHVGSKCPK